MFKRTGFVTVYAVAVVNIFHQFIIVTEFRFCASVNPTSQADASGTLLLPTAGNYKVGIWGGLQCHNLYVKFIHNFPVVPR